MKYGLCLITLLLTGTVALKGQEQQPGLFRTVLDAEQIRDAGITRLSELFFLIEEWDGYSLDGIDWFASANGLSPYQNQNWIVLLDGQRTDLQYVDTQNINMLPVSLSLIDEVVILHTPQLYQGEFSERGLIHIKTKKPRQGTSVSARMASGNEINDPGPYELTEFRSHNVERIGPDFDLDITQTLNRWHFRVGLSTHEHKNTDLPINRRIRSMRIVDDVWHDGNLYMHAPSVNLGWNGENQYHTFYGGHTRFRDFLFFKPFGREIPVISGYSHAGLNGEFRSSGQSSLRYRTSWTSRDLNYRRNAFELDFDLQLTNLHGNVEYQVRGDAVETTAGVSITQTGATTGYNLSSNHYYLSSMYSNLRTRLFPGTQQSFDAVLQTDLDHIGLKTALNQQWLIQNNQTLGLSLSYSRRLFAEDQSLWFWVDRGYGFLTEMGVDHIVDGEIRSGRQFTADLMWQKNWEEGHRLSFATYYRSLRNTWLSEQDFEYISGQGWFEAPTFIHTDLDSDMAGFQTRLSLHLLPSLKQELYYGYRRVISGDDELKNSWDTMPVHQIQSKTTFKPVEGFTMFGKVRFRSSTTWDEFARIDGEEYEHILGLAGGTYSSVLPAITTVDLALRKSFWKDKLFGSLLARNIFDRDHFYHPIGIDYDLTLFIQVEVRL